TSLTRTISSVSRRSDLGSLHHQNHRAHWCACAMGHALRHREAFTRLKLDHATGCSVSPRLEVDQEAALDDIEELIVFVVLVPVILPLHDAQSHDGVVHSAEGLVVPLILYRRDERIELDSRERSKQDI